MKIIHPHKPLPIVKCFACGMNLRVSFTWCIHPSGVYCVDCAPFGSLHLS